MYNGNEWSPRRPLLAAATAAAMCKVFRLENEWWKKKGKKKRISGRPDDLIISHPVHRKQTFFLVLPYSHEDLSLGNTKLFFV